MTADDVLAFWFDDALGRPAKAERRMRFWFGSDRQTDEEIRQRFAPALKAASRGALAAWEAEPRSRLALVIVLDQLPRNIHRGTPAAFEHDAQALEVARRGIAAGDLDRLTTLEQGFFLMPFQHCEDVACQREGMVWFEQMTREAPPAWRGVADGMLKYAGLHFEIVERFGRFPHRNQILGRESTPAEIEYLKSNKESFGQSG